MKYRVAVTFILYNLFAFATLLLEVPIVRMIEQAICNQHFRRIAAGSIDERDCKIPEIQSVLAKVIAWKMSFDALPGLLTALYYGSLADKHGRRFVLSLSIGGYVMMLVWLVFVCVEDTVFPVQTLWLSSLFLLSGGGQRIFNSIIFTLVSDSLEHSSRAKYLYLLAAGPHFCRLITPRIAAGLMAQKLIYPFWFSFTIFGVISALVPFVSEVKQPVRDKDLEVVGYGTSGINYKAEDAREFSTFGHEPEDFLDEIPTDAPLLNEVGNPNPERYLRRIGGNVSNIAMRRLLRQKMGDLWILFQGPATRFSLAAFFMKRVAFTSEGFMFQYTSEKFGWALRETTWLRVASAAGAVFVTLLVCPILTWFFKRRGVSSHVLDLNVIRGALLVLIISFFGAWKASSGIFLTIAMLGCGLGEGLEPALQSLVTYLTDSAGNAQLFTTVALFDTLAELTGGPITARLLAIGRSDGHPSSGICFLASSMMFMLLFVWALSVRARRTGPLVPWSSSFEEQPRLTVPNEHFH